MPCCASTSRRTPTIDWAGVILDEAQFVKNHNSKTHQCVRRLDARFKLAITGTPMENNLMELWSLLSITAPGLFPSPAVVHPALPQADRIGRPTPNGWPCCAGGSSR